MPGPVKLLGGALACALIAVGVLALVGRSDDCGTGSALLRARMLDAAVARLDQGSCAAAVARADGARADAAKAFARAHVYLAAGTQSRADAKAAAARMAAAKAVLKDQNTARRDKPQAVEDQQHAAHDVRTAEANALTADRYAAFALVAGLSRDPFRGAEAAPLSATLGRLAQPGSADTICALARQMVQTGLLAQAESALGLTANPDAACADASVQVQQQRASAGTARRAAEAARAGDHDDAALGHDADALLADTGVGASQVALTAAGTDRSSALDDVVGWLGDIPDRLADVWPAVLVALTGLALLALALFIGLRYWAFRNATLRRWLVPDKDPSRLGQRIASLRVRVADFTGGASDGKLAGGDAAALVGEALGTAHLKKFPFDYVPAAEADGGALNQFTDVLAEIPHGKLAGALLKLFATLFGPRTAVVDGRLLPASTGGVGLALVVRAPGGRVAAGTVLRDGQIDPAPGGDDDARWARLLKPAGVWVRHGLAPLAGKELGGPADAWLPEALTEAARDWFRAGDLPRATTCYTRALEARPSLLPALNNLAVVEIRQKRYAAAMLRLHLLEDRIDSDGRKRWPALGEAARYNLALALMYHGLPARAQESARTLGVALLRELDCAAKPDEARTRLRAAELPSLLLLAGILVRRPAQAEAALEPLRRTPAAALASPHPCRKRRDLLEVLDRPAGTPLPARAAAEIVAYASEDRDKPPRARYNLACFYSTLTGKVPPGEYTLLKRCQDLALFELDMALEDAELVPWAGRDPSLRPVRESRPNAWSDIVMRHTPAKAG